MALAGWGPQSTTFSTRTSRTSQMYTLPDWKGIGISKSRATAGPLLARRQMAKWHGAVQGRSPQHARLGAAPCHGKHWALLIGVTLAPKNGRKLFNVHFWGMVNWHERAQRGHSARCQIEPNSRAIRRHTYPGRSDPTGNLNMGRGERNTSPLGQNTVREAEHPGCPFSCCSVRPRWMDTTAWAHRAGQAQYTPSASVDSIFSPEGAKVTELQAFS